MFSFKYGDTVISYSIIKSSRRKTSQIIVDKTGVIVRIPDTKSIKETKLMVLQKVQWIFKKKLYYKKQIPQIPQVTFKKGTTLPFKGKNYPFVIITCKSAKIKLVKNIIQFHITQKRHSIPQLKKMYQDWVLKQAEMHFPKVFKKYYPIVGKPIKITLKDLKGRWGSTTTKEEIILNSNLIKSPLTIIEYVILHELCHLKIKEHNQQFWNLLSKHMPRYRDHIKWLEVNGTNIT